MIRSAPNRLEWRERGIHPVPVRFHKTIKIKMKVKGFTYNKTAMTMTSLKEGGGGERERGRDSDLREARSAVALLVSERAVDVDT